MADRYWNPAAAANWNAANAWATTDGGDPTGIATPTSDDDVFFTSTNVSNCTITANANCLNFSTTGGTGYTGTFGGTTSYNINIYGSFTLNSGVNIATWYTLKNFVATATGKTITTAGKVISATITFNGSGGEWTLQDNFACNNGVTITNGSLVTANKAFNVNYSGSGSFVISNNTNTRSLTLGTSTFTTGSIDVSGTTNLTFSAASSTINMTGNITGSASLTFGTVNITIADGNTYIIETSHNFSTLTVTGNANKGNLFRITAGTTQTISGTLTINGNSAINRLYVQSNTKGTTYTLNAATVSANAIDIQDCTGAGAGSWDISGAALYTGDCGGNSGITFTTADECFWVHGASASYNWSASQWAHESGGTVDQRVPLPQDTAIFDAGSFAADGKTVVQDMPRIGGVTFADTDQAFTFTPSTTCAVFGNITLDSNLTFGTGTQTYTFEYRGVQTLDCAGKTWEKGLTVNSVNGVGTLKLVADCTLGVTRTLTITSGTFTCVDGASNYVFSTGVFSMAASTVLTLGSATHLITKTTGTIWTGNGTISANTSTIKFNGALTGDVTFAGGNKDYNGASFWNATTNNYSCIITGGNTFADFKIDAGRTQKFTAATTTTMTSLTAVGTDVAGITITSVTAANHTLSDTTGTNTVSYCTISRSTAQGGAVWDAYDGTNTDGGNNSGWLFTEPSTATENFFLVF